MGRQSRSRNRTESNLAEATNLYDETPYPPLSHADTHPDHLAAVAILLGLKPPAVDACRVLEIGAASGGNLLPMAAGLPGSQFVGVDYSAVQVAAGNESVAALGLENTRFVCADIRAMQFDEASFDYIIAHGVYSWVPADVREALLAACSRLLSPDGVAYVSYNTYPGWHSLLAIREMMLHGSKYVDDPRARVKAATETVKFIENHAQSDSPLSTHLELYSRLIDPRDEMDAAQADALVLHDLLSKENEPCYYHEFVAHAGRHGVEPLGDADFPSMFPRGLSRDALQALSSRVRSRVDFEQYLDFFRDRSFRKSLLSRDVSSLQPTIHPNTDLMSRLCAHTRANLAEPFDILGPSAASLVAPTGARLSTDHPLSKAAFAELAEAAPQAIGFDDLLVRASKRLGKAGAAGVERGEDIAAVASNLLEGFSYDEQLIDLRTHEASVVAEPPAHPHINPVARHFAAKGARTLTNAYHKRVKIEPIHAVLISLLDGRRNRAQLREELHRLIEVGTRSKGKKPTLDGLIDESLAFFADAALLVP